MLDLCQSLHGLGNLAGAPKLGEYQPMAAMAFPKSGRKFDELDVLRLWDP